MTEEAAAWVREHVLSGRKRSFRAHMADRCRCEWGLSPACAHGTTPEDHARCATAAGPIYEWETIVGAKRGFPEPHKHPVRVGPGARILPGVPVYVSVPYVWLADRICRWVCPCPCHGGGEQLDLFGGAL